MIGGELGAGRHFARPHKSLANPYPRTPANGCRRCRSRLDADRDGGTARLTQIAATHRLVLMAPNTSVKQFRQACAQVGLTTKEYYEASDEFHAYKATAGEGDEDMDFGDLVAWLREWKDS